jgi:hypothetical protein
MQAARHIQGQNEDEVWQQIEADLAQDPDLLFYRVVIHQQDRIVLLDIDIDLGGGFEGGFATTTFSAPLQNPGGFTFALHREHFIDELGRFFGMQDIETGYPDFDASMIVKASDTGRVRALVADSATREALLSLENFSFGILPAGDADGDADTHTAVLELSIEEGITDPARLRSLYRMFFHTLTLLD